MMVGRRTVRLIVMLGAVCGLAGAVRAAPVKNIVLVHGAWVDGSGWPDLERMNAARAHSHLVEVAGASHSVYRTHPKEVAALIEEAARQAGDAQPAAPH